ncbi:MAG: EAL domain-containing protein [Firmicutes bacterium]|nr:EAL domain-containing protein [Bacillota bacterium]
MNKNNDNTPINYENKKLSQEALNYLSLNRKVPIIWYFILIILYVITSFFVKIVAGGENITVTLGEASIPLSTFAGVLTSLANLCLIIIVSFYGRLGFITSLIALIMQIISLSFGIIFGKNLTSLPGLFITVFTLISVILLYINNENIAKFRAKIDEQAVTDRLTGIPNMFACSQLFNDFNNRLEKYAIVSIDINNFKSINNTMGFEIGNKILIEISKRWQKTAETLTHNFIARVSGDEFCLVIWNFKTEDDVLETIKKYEQAVSECIVIDGYDFYITASYGYAFYPSDSEVTDTVFTYSNAAMTEVKRINSSNHILRFKTDFLKTEHILEIEHKLRTAIENDTIFFNLQPEYDTEHNLRGFEALARMRDSDNNIISPGEFIPVAEKVGLIDRIDSIIFRKAAMFFGEILKKYHLDITLSINVSVRHLMKNDFLDELRQILKESGVPEKNLEIEITESIMIDSVEKALQVINEIENMGIQIAIDDFGTGYSSLSYLNKFPANLLKIDKSFIDKINTSESSKQYVAAIISIGHIMGFDVISEGVEEQTQLDTLKEIGCDYIQGFLWGRPLPYEQAEEVVKNEAKKLNET